MDIMIKINNTQNYKNKLVCEGILKMVDSKPIILSESEKIEVGDWTLANGKLEQVLQMQLGENGVWQYKTSTAWFSNCIKVIALPEHFSPQQLQDIVNGKLKEGKCLVECENIQTTKKEDYQWTQEGSNLNYVNIIKLNPHITIYNVEEKMYTREEILPLLHRLVKDGLMMEDMYPDTWVPKAIDKWFEQNIK